MMKKYNVDDLKCCGNCVKYKFCMDEYYGDCICKDWKWDKKTQFERQQL